MTIQEITPGEGHPSTTGGLTILDALARAARQVALYGPEHPLGKQALEDSCEQLADLKEANCIEAEVGELRWNGQPVNDRGNIVAQFLSAMRARLIARIDLRPPVHPDHLGQLLSLLSLDPQELLLSGGAVAGLTGLRCGCVSLQEYDLSDESLIPSSVWHRLAMGSSGSDKKLLRDLIRSCEREASCSNVDDPALATLDVAVSPAGAEDKTASEEVVAAGLAQMLQQAGEQAYDTSLARWEHWRNRITMMLSTLSSTWRGLLLRAPVRITGAHPDMLGLLATGLSVEECISALLNDSKPLHAERSEGLTLALQRVLADRKRRSLMQNALQLRAKAQCIPQVTYHNVVGLLISGLLGELEGDSASRVPLDSLKSSLASEKLDISNLLTTVRLESVRQSRLHMLKEAVSNVVTINRYSAGVGMLAAAVEECAQRQDTDGLILALAAIEHETVSSKRDSSWHTIARSALTRLHTEQIVTCLISAIPKADEMQTLVIASLLGVLGEAGIRELKQLAMTGDCYQAEAAIAVLLERDEDDCPHLREILACASGLRRVEMLQTLVDAIGERSVARLRAIVSEAGDEVKIELIRIIAKSHRTELAQALLPWLQEHSQVGLACIEAIAALSFREAIPQLCEALQSLPNDHEGIRLKEAIIVTLGTLQANMAVPLLCGFLRGGDFLTKLVTVNLRVAAAGALAAIGGTEARWALKQGQKSLHPAVRKACLRGIDRMLLLGVEHAHALG